MLQAKAEVIAQRIIQLASDREEANSLSAELYDHFMRMLTGKDYRPKLQATEYAFYTVEMYQQLNEVVETLIEQHFNRQRLSGLA